MSDERHIPRAAAWPGAVLLPLLLLLCAQGTRAQTHVFVRGTDGALWHYDGTRWVSRGGQIVGAPDTCSWGPNRFDVVARGTDNKLHQASLVDGRWSGWYNHGGVLTSSPTCVSWGPNRIDVFARGSDGSLIHRAFGDEGWTGWESLGDFLEGTPLDSDTSRRGDGPDDGRLPEGAAPDAASWGEGRLDVFVRGRDDALWQKAWDGTQWSRWHRLGGHITSDPGAVSWGPNRIDIFARGADGQMVQMAWDGTRWTDWAPQGGSSDAGSGPDASSAGPERLDIFVRGTDGALWRKRYDGGAWGDWAPLGGRLTSDPGAVAARGPRARFRVTLNGFAVNRETWDHALHADGRHDEVYVLSNALVIDARTNVRARQTLRSRVMGEVNDEDWRTARVRAGSATDRGGLRTGDSVPSREPWRRTAEPQADRLPMLMWEGELVEGETAVVIMPTIWEWDGGEELLGRWEADFNSGLSFTGLWLGDGGRGFAVSNVEEAFGTMHVSDRGAMRLSRPRGRPDSSLGAVGDRPIAMRSIRPSEAAAGEDYFSAQQFVLTYAGARAAATTSYGGKGPGVFEIRYRDHDDLGGGEYTLYLHVERLP